MSDENEPHLTADEVRALKRLAHKADLLVALTKEYEISAGIRARAKGWMLTIVAVAGAIGGFYVIRDFLLGAK